MPQTVVTTMTATMHCNTVIQINCWAAVWLYNSE